MNKLDFLTCGFLNHENIFTKKAKKQEDSQFAEVYCRLKKM